MKNRDLIMVCQFQRKKKVNKIGIKILCLIGDFKKSVGIKDTFYFLDYIIFQLLKVFGKYQLLQFFFKQV